ncbi:TonB-dependent receptor [Nitrosomonas sp.]|uniref:TonB-dependent receptor plug domain-containing protein n=1 Tax=Nitrosomonas sp. TaxID=42353 RepID=UPI00260EC479|nr:TonB-dependent receptor [Nitrosomonas sp.]MCW5601344.1 TonB-dependent receptor [Nitrosomonas sp.]
MAILPAQATKHLEELSLEELMQIRVVGVSKYEQSQQQVAAAVSVITRNDIKTYGWRTLGEALTSLPGVHTTYDRQYTYFGTRGFGLPGDFNTRVLISINGNRINDATYDQGPIGREFPLDLDLIERIEFIPGPGSAVYGQNAMLGVVNIVTRKGNDVNGIELSGSYNTLQSTFQDRVTMGKTFDNGLDALVSFTGIQSKGQDLFFDFGNTGISGTARGQDGEDVKQFYAQLRRGPLSFDFIYGNRRKEVPTAAYLSDPLVPGQFERDLHLRTQIQYNDYFLNDTLNVLGRVFLGQFRYHSPATYEGAKTLATGPSDWHGAEIRFVSTAVARHKLMLGVEYQNNTRIQQTTQVFVAPQDNVDIESAVLRTGVYLQDEWQITETLAATAGLRYDYNGWIGSRLSPRGALIWQATPKATLKALYGRAHRAPNSYERDFADGISQIANPHLNSETIDTVELIADYRITESMNLRTALYRWNMRNLIVFRDNPEQEKLPFFQQSDVDVIARGVEFSADKTWSWGGRLRASFALQDDKFAQSRLVNSPQYLSKLNFTTPLPFAGLRLGYELQYNSKRKTLDDTHVGGYVLSNLNLMTDVRAIKGLQASLALYNLFDEHYLHPASDNNWQNSIVQDGRSVRFRLDYRF